MPLKRHPALIPLSHAHQKGLFTANYIRTGAPTYPGLPTALADKKAYVLNWQSAHWEGYKEVEEEILFPFVVSKTSHIQSLTEDAQREHQQIDYLLASLIHLAENELQEHFDCLHAALVPHIRKEERQLFEAIQQMLTEAEMADLGKQIQAFYAKNLT